MGVTVDSVTHSMTTSKNLGDVLKITIKAEGQTMDVYMISVDNYLIGIDAIKTDDEKLSPSINAAVKYLLKTIDFVD